MKKLLMLILCILVIGAFAYFYIDYYNKDKTDFSGLGYNDKSINFITENNIQAEVLSYSKTLEKLIEDNSVNTNYISEYLLLDYIEKDEYGEIVNKLLDLGYSATEINEIIKYTKLDDVEYIINNKRNENIIKYLKEKFFLYENIERYEKYLEKNSNYSLSTIIMNVNIGLDYSFYANTKETDINKEKLMIVNKYNYLPSDYKGSNIVEMSTDHSVKGKYLNKEAYGHFKDMVNSAKKDGIELKNISSYRSYSYQSSLYNKYVKRDGKNEADTYSARPGYSEHQTGYALDINVGSRSAKFEKTKEYEWLINNSYKYGFFLRYPEGKENITGYLFEPWHYRYVGIEPATTIHNEKITFEEYYVKYVLN